VTGSCSPCGANREACFTGFGTEFCGYKCVENTQTDGRLKLAIFGSVLLLALALVLVAPLRAAAQGGPPLLTDDPGTPAQGTGRSIPRLPPSETNPVGYLNPHLST
jgi:hypothetical protein